MQSVEAMNGLVFFKVLAHAAPKGIEFSENVWSEAQVWFFWVCLGSFGFFGFDLEKAKKQVFFGFLDKLMVKEL